MKQILVVEDNGDIRDNICEILSLANYKVLAAADGKAGAVLAIKHKPDLVICDIMMPVLDGFGLLQLLQQNKETRNTAFIFLTAKAEKAEIRKGMEKGADDYITKPFDATELLQAVEMRLKKIDSIKEDLATDIARLDKINDNYSENDILKLLIENRDTSKYKKKQVVYFEGNRPVGLFYVLSGKVKTYKTNTDGKNLVMGLFNEGDFLGYVALLEGGPYKEMAEAMDNTELAIIPKEEFDRLINSNMKVARKFIGMLAGNVTEREKHLLGIAYNSLRKKVAEALISLHKKYKDTINISRESLASVAGTATESLIRTLGDFKNEKLIDIIDGVITILDEKRLQTLSN